MDIKDYKKQYFRVFSVVILINMVVICGFAGFLFYTIDQFNRVHVNSFEKVMAVEEISVAMLKIQDQMVSLGVKPTTKVVDRVKKNIQEEHEEILEYFSVLKENSAGKDALNEIILLYEQWQVFKEATLVSGLQSPVGVQAMIKLAEINSKLGVLEEVQYKSSDKAYENELQRIQYGVLFLCGFMVLSIALVLRQLVKLKNKTLKYVDEIYDAQFLYTVALGAMSDPILVVNRDTGDILDANAGAASFFGYSVDQLKQMKNIDISAEPEKTLENNCEDILAIPFMLLKNSKGEVLPVEIKNSIFQWKGNRAHVAWIHDLTAQMEFEQKLIVAKDSAEAGNRAKSSFLANISHELRTPMTGILGIFQVLKMTETDLSRRRHIDLGIESSQALTRLLDNIINYSQLESGDNTLKFEPFSLKTEVLSMISLYQLEAEANGNKLEVEMKDCSNQLYFGDSFRIRQIVIHLLSNAIKFTNKGVIKVTVSCRAEEEKDQDRIMISVADTGCGIKQEYMDKVFEWFSQADGGTTKAFQGAGIGLAIVKALLKLMNGKIDFNSTYGVGSEFIVTLPLKKFVGKVEVDERTNLKRMESGLKTTRSKILVVEDDRTTRLVMFNILQSLGYVSDEASTPEEVMTLLKGSLYQLILMDLQLPGMSGTELTKEIRKMSETGNSEIPIIAVTAYSGSEIRQRCQDADMQDFIEKPVQIKLVESVIKKWIRDI